MACRFPGDATDPGRFWALLRDGVDAITAVPEDRFDVDALFDSDPGAPGKLYVRWGGFVEGIDEFDAEFFGISPREARRLDPQHRLLLEVAWEALEDGGQSPDRLAASPVGVFVGISSHDYGDLHGGPGQRHLIDAYGNSGGALSMAANRISYHLDLRGPSLAVDTACSSALTAVHLACRSLHSTECELAIVGGANVLLSPEATIGFCKAGMLSPDGRCRPFDARANGYVRSEGAAAVVLKPLRRAIDDGDPIRAVIRGTAVNQDGLTHGITVPSLDAQSHLLREALASAGLRPDQLQYVEAHGTGTPVGDPVEAEAIGQVLGAGRLPEQPCLIGSVKSNLGHLEAASGLAGLIKTVLCLEQRYIPATIHFAEPNPAIPFDELCLRVASVGQAWPATDGPAFAGVNSFGFGGANAHVILESCPLERKDPTEDGEGPVQVATLSARSPQALSELAHAWVDRLDDDQSPSLRGVCHTAATRRAQHAHRLAVVAGSREELAGYLGMYLAGEELADVVTGSTAAEPPRLAFVFSGMGPQWWGMGRELMLEEPVFRDALAECDRLLQGIAGWSLLDELAADEASSRVDESRLAHVANLAIQVGLAALWRSWGIEPDAVAGHSSGETGAAYVAGALPLADALRVAFHRGRLFDRMAGTGGMLAAQVSAEAAADLIAGHEGEVCVAAVNSPSSVTLSGELDVLAGIEEALRRDGVFCRPLHVDVPYHGPQLEGLKDEFVEALSGLDCRSPSASIISTVTGEESDGRPLDAAYWWRNLRQPVRFAEAMQRLIDDGCTLFLELGPHPVLGAAIRECLAAAGRDGTVLASLRRGQPERRTMFRSLAGLHVHGRQVDWATALGPGGRFTSLPTYPWQRERHWVDTAPVETEPPGTDAGHPLLGQRLRAVRPTWEVGLGNWRLEYLDGHAVQGAVTFPAAAYVEMALAAARALRPAGPLVLEHVELRRLLAMAARSDQLLQCVLDDQRATIEIHAARTGADTSWSLHARAWLGSRSASANGEPPADVEAIRRRCPERVPTDLLYRRAEERGLSYGPPFRGVAELWGGSGEALGRIHTPASLAGVDEYHVHPALLDAAMQVLAAALDTTEAPNGAIVPVSIDRIEFRKPAGGAFWAHGRLSHRLDGGLEGSVRLVDDAGELALACEGIRLRALDQRSPRVGQDWLYREDWEELPPRRAQAADLPAPGALAEAVRPGLERAAAERDTARYYAEVEPALNALTGCYVRDARAVTQHDDILPGQRRRWSRLLETLGADHEPVSPDALVRTLLAAHPEYRPMIELVRQSGERLAGTLRGQEDATQWLFTGAAWEALAATYTATPPFQVVNRVVAEVVAEAQQRSPGQPLRIVEVGAGTGGTTAFVLEQLDGAAVEYAFTDISPFMLRRARERFGDRSGLRFEALDIEREPVGAELQYDVAIAVNVIHATADVRATLRNLRRLLVPGGLLVLQEGIRQSPWLDLVFGQLEGWWRATDLDLRPAHPLLGVHEWQRLLEDAGLRDPECITDSPVDGGEPVMAVFVAGAPEAGSSAASAGKGKRWLILADRGGVAATVAAALERRGDSCTLIEPGTRGWTDMLRGPAGTRAVDGFVHLGALDMPAPADLTTPGLMDAAEDICASVAALARAVRSVDGVPPDVWLVTAGAQRSSREGTGPQLAQAPLWGVGRVLRNEYPGLRCRLVDLGSGCPPGDVEALVDELAAGDPPEPEHELLIRDGRLLARRLRPAPLDSTTPPVLRERSPVADVFQLEIGTLGALETLALRDAATRPPGPGEVELRVEAAGLNFKDVLLALGMLSLPSGTTPTLGFECVGVVTACGENVDALRPGDEVIAIATGAFASRVVTRAELVAPRPRRLSVEEAATVPGPFGTAVLALEELARLESGERVLIHSAAGGVGLAAVQIAKRAGAEIFATAGTPERRAFLESLGIEHVMDSRSLAWVDEVRNRSGGEGVDVVLNSLAGDALTRGVEVLRPYGRFVEIGKRDIQRNAPLGLLPFERSLSFFSLHLDQLVAERPDRAGALLRRIVHEFDDGALEPLPHTVFDLAEAEHAFRFMAQARHTGRVVLTVGEPMYRVGTRSSTSPFRSDATYLIVGGLGGLGLKLAGHMARRGVRRLVLAGRSGTPHPEDEQALSELGATGAEILLARCDAADAEDLSRLLDSIRATEPPLRGVIHAAAVLDDGLLEGHADDSYRAVLAPKVAGAWNLHELTLGDDLDLFVLFSSFSSVLGPPGQGNYAAANAFLDALAGYRRSRSLPALAINFGALADAGFVMRYPQVRDYMERLGVVGMPTDDAWAILEELLRRDVERRMVACIDWSSWSEGPAAALRSTVFGPLAEIAKAAQAVTEDAGAGNLRSRLRDEDADGRAVLLERYLVSKVAGILETTPQRLDAERPLVQMGLDSLMAVELMTAMQNDLGVSVALADLLQSVSLSDLTRLAVDSLASATAA